MQLALDIGTINIQNQEIARFIQNKSIEEIKSLFIDFLITAYILEYFLLNFCIRYFKLRVNFVTGI